VIESDPHPVFLVLKLDPNLNMLKRIRGPGWGASTKLIVQSCKVLIRPIIDYVPFTTITMSKPLQLKDCSGLPSESPLTGLAMKYLTKAVTTNNIANETVNDYLRTGIKDDGAYWKPTNRPTLLGLIKRRALAIKHQHK
jgi:hypothetical protein